jgi:cell division protein FtsW
MIYSSSFPRALYETGDSAYYFKRQLLFAALGIGAMLAISRVRPELLRKLAFPVLGASILFLILVFVPGIGQTENGATRWVRLGISFQPSEIAKLGVILSFAALITAFGEKMETFRWGIMPFGPFWWSLWCCFGWNPTTLPLSLSPVPQEQCCSWVA